MIRRSWAIFLRYLYLFGKLDQIADLLYWPVVDIVLWGVTTAWIQEKGVIPHIGLVIMTGLVFWQIVWRGNYEISINLLQEFWNRNLVNIFSTPLRLREWIIGVLFLSICKIGIALLFGVGIVYLLYSLNIFTLGFPFVPFTLSLMISGWVIGFFAASVVVYYGQRVQMIAWMTAYLFAPFSAVFYPVSVLPIWGQKIAYSLPTTYIFEGMREIIHSGTYSWTPLYYSLSLNLIYLTLSITIFCWSFEKSRKKGLARFE